MRLRLRTFPARREAPKMLVIPCKYCWAGKEAEREAVVVGPAA